MENLPDESEILAYAQEIIDGKGIATNYGRLVVVILFFLIFAEK